MRLTSIFICVALVFLMLFSCVSVPSTPPDSITLQVVDPFGSAIKNAEVVVAAGHNEMALKIGYTDESGYVLYKNPIIGPNKFFIYGTNKVFTAKRDINESDLGTVVKLKVTAVHTLD